MRYNPYTGEHQALQEQFSALPELMRPIVLLASLSELPTVLATQAPSVLFDRSIGRNALGREPDKVATVQYLAKLLRELEGLVLVKIVPRHAQRLYCSLDTTKLDADLSERIVATEEAI